MSRLHKVQRNMQRIMKEKERKEKKKKRGEGVGKKRED
jgi:hypothetical protein